MSYMGTKGFFDPRLLGMWIDDNVPSYLRQHLLPPLKARLPSIRDALRSLSSSDRFAIYHHTTTVTHEMKHFHDMVGTPFGFTYTFTRLSREAHLSRLIRSLPRIRVPLKVWAESVDCDEGILNFLEIERSHDSFARSLFYNRSFPGEEIQIPGLFLMRDMPDSGGDTNTPQRIAVVNYGYDVCKRQGIRHHYYPFTTSAILESAAINVQHVQVCDFFGLEAGTDFLNHYWPEMFRSDLWVYAMAMHLINVTAARFECASSESLRYKFLEFPLMGRCAEGQFESQDIPGWRMANFLSYLHYAYPKRQLTPGDLLTILEEFRHDHLKEPPLNSVLHEHLDSVDQLCVLMGADSGYVATQETLDTIPQHAMFRFARLHRTMLRIRLSNPEFFDNPWEYLCNIEKLPKPPHISFQEDDKLHVSADMLSAVAAAAVTDLIGLSDSELWSLCFASTRILEDLVSRGMPACAFRDWGVQCPKSGKCTAIPEHKPSAPGCICDSAFKLIGHDDLEIVPANVGE